MELIADVLLVAGALAAGFYCFVLGRRLNKFNSLEKGVGGAVATLSLQVEDLAKALESAKKTSSQSAEDLEILIKRSEAVERNLELKIASLHDLQASTHKHEPNNTIFEKSAPQDAITQPLFVRRQKIKEAP